MDRDHRHQRRDLDSVGVGQGATPGRSTLVESEPPAAEAPRAIPRLELRPSGTGKGGRATSLGAGPDGAAPAAAHGPAAPAAAATADPAHAPAETAGHPDAAAPDATGQAMGWGVSDVISGIVNTVSTAIDAAMTAAGIPIVKHATQDHAPGGAPDTRTTVGVGEMITFESNMPGTWTASLVHPGTGRTGHGQRYNWLAPSTPGTAKITFDPGGGKPKVETEITVIAPQIDYLNARALAFPGQASGVPGVAMTTDITFTPDNVSFANVMWWEQPGPASGATGYFRRKRLPFHHPNSSDLQSDDHNSPGTDDAGFWGFGAPFSNGAFEWSIPTKYKVVGDSARHLITNVHQRCTMAPDGTMTVTKGSSSFSRAP